MPIIMNDHFGRPWILIHDDFEPELGGIYQNFRGEDRGLVGGTPPNHPASTGRVLTDEGEFFPSTLHMRWERYVPPVKPDDEVQKRVDRISEIVGERTRYTRLKSGENAAAELGLDPLGGHSCYAMAVGTPPEMPDIVVKVMHEDDPCLHYYMAIDGEKIEDEHFPVIHAINEVMGTYVVVMERLYDAETVNTQTQVQPLVTTCSELNPAIPGLIVPHIATMEFVKGPKGRRVSYDEDRWSDEVTEALDMVLCHMDDEGQCVAEDLHNENLMWRMDGTPVLLDPVA